MTEKSVTWRSPPARNAWSLSLRARTIWLKQLPCFLEVKEKSTRLMATTISASCSKSARRDCVAANSAPDGCGCCRVLAGRLYVREVEGAARSIAYRTVCTHRIARRVVKCGSAQKRRRWWLLLGLCWATVRFRKGFPSCQGYLLIVCGTEHTHLSNAHKCYTVRKKVRH